MKFVAYYRVSEMHGLALNSLRNSVERHVTQEGGKLIREFIETVTDFGQVGEVFEAAVRQCRRDKAVLVLAESDPLSRQLGMLARLVQQHVSLSAAGHSDVNKVLEPLFTDARADGGSGATKSQTKKKSSGNAMRGNPELECARKTSSEVRRKKADEFAAKYYDDVFQLRTHGHSFAAIAELFNAAGRQGPRGGSWHATSISNLMKRCLCDSQKRPTG
ncbi:hypothetical protein ACFIQF_23355 [Comamonas sp. J-3]|uniref:hypothetical protein n=1 Tax=Comamonas trifloxystrobinivorans TaxID=3350256 RepID=UPI003726A226